MNKIVITDKVSEAIRKEQEYQHNKYGSRKQSFAGYLLILERELQEAKDGWIKGIQEGRHSPLHEVLQILTVALNCLEDYGIEGCPRPTADFCPLEANQRLKDDF